MKPQDIEVFVKELNWPYEVKADSEYKVFNMYYKSLQVPGAALLTENGKVLKIYKQKKLDLSELGADLNEALQ